MIRDDDVNADMNMSFLLVAIRIQADAGEVVNLPFTLSLSYPPSTRTCLS